MISRAPYHHGAPGLVFHNIERQNCLTRSTRIASSSHFHCLQKEFLLPSRSANVTKLRAARPGTAAASKPAPDDEPVSSEHSGARLSSSDQLVLEIMRGLYQGRFVPGQKLTEVEITERFGVGRSTVREAFRRLAAEGIVSINLHRGANIRSLSREDARDVLEVIEALASLAARRAAERLSAAEDIKALRGALKALTTAAADRDSFEFGRLRGRFYRLVAQVSGNKELARMLPTVQAHLIRVQFRSVYQPNAQGSPLNDYRGIVEAILAKDPAGAERAMRQHIRTIARLIDKLNDDAFRF